MAFRIGSTTFVHADGVTKLIPLEGQNANNPFLVRAVKSLDAQQNGKAISLQGQNIAPEAVAIASIEPSWKLGLDVMQVSIDLLEFAGSGAARMHYEIVTVFQRPGLAAVTFICEDAVIEKGFSVTSEAGDAPKDEFSGKMRRLLIRYRGKLYDPYTVPGGVALF
jgi:hypothetical protein